MDNIADATGNHLDLVIVTHEHQDHLNGIWPHFERFTIDEAWMAWTEDPDDRLANELRKRHHDQLISLVRARTNLAAKQGVDHLSVRRLDSLLDIELGEEGATVALGARLAGVESRPTAGVRALDSSFNKQALKLVRKKALEPGHQGVQYLEPGGIPIGIRDSDVRVFVLGPPRDADLLRDENPKESEAFPDERPSKYTFAAAASPEIVAASPFSRPYVVPFDSEGDPDSSFFLAHYGKEGDGVDDPAEVEVPASAAWRRIDDEWLYSSVEALALKLNTGVNNTSLVLAFELPASGKILLFTGDAQRGNWKSWSKLRWQDGETTVTARELLGRTVLYKVGHHGSHNATLRGTESDDYANLSWMATGSFAGEFTAMIPAVTEWAKTKNRPPWIHPLPSIRRELLRKAQGRVFQTDIGGPQRPAQVPLATWRSFAARCKCEDLYFDYTIPDSKRHHARSGGPGGQV